MGKKAPAAPSPDVTAAAQAGMNRDTAITNQQLNMIDQYNPYGSVTYSPNGFDTFVDSKGNTVQTPKYSQTTTFSPEQQALYDEDMRAQQNLAGLATQQSGMLAEHLGQGWQGLTNRDVENWAYDLGMQRIAPQQEEDRNRLMSQLKNRGIQEGSAAWNSEVGRFDRSVNDQRNQLALTGRSQAYNEALTDYNQPINTITALMSGSQVTNPTAGLSATPQTQVGGVDYTGLVNQNYQNQLGAYQSKMGGIGGLFGSVLGAAGQAGGFGALFSDERLKENIRRVGRTDAGLPIYVYNYIGDQATHMGVMAQEALVSQPEAVHQHDSGYLMVNYGDVR